MSRQLFALHPLPQGAEPVEHTLARSRVIFNYWMLMKEAALFFARLKDN